MIFKNIHTPFPDEDLGLSPKWILVSKWRYGTSGPGARARPVPQNPAIDRPVERKSSRSRALIPERFLSLAMISSQDGTHDQEHY